MAWPKVMTDEQRARIEAVARERARIPTDKELARECGVTTRHVQRVMEQIRRKQDASIPMVSGYLVMP